MSTPAIGFSIPSSAVSASFTDGEQAVSPGSGVASPTYLAKWFILDGGIYTIKLWGADIVTAYIGAEGTSIRRIATATSASVEAGLFTHPGKQRIDIALLKTTTDIPYFVFSLWQGGKMLYASAADGWVFSETAIIDADVPYDGDVRKKLPVWSVLPNWAESITERLSWLTDILPSETDSEQRRSLTAYPRRSLEASFLRIGANAQRMDAFIAALGRRSFMVPVWFEQLRIPMMLDPFGVDPLPVPYMRETFTAVDGTLPTDRSMDIQPEPWNNWQLGWSGGAVRRGVIRSNRLEKAFVLADYFRDIEIMSGRDLGTGGFPQIYPNSWTLVVDVDVVPSWQRVDYMREDIEIWFYNYFTLTIKDNGQVIVRMNLSGAPNVEEDHPAIGGGRMKFSFRYSVDTWELSRNGTLLASGSMGTMFAGSVYEPQRVFIGAKIYDRLFLQGVELYTDLTPVQAKQATAPVVAPLAIPDAPVAPGTLTLLFRDSFTASDGTSPISRSPDFISPDWTFFSAQGWAEENLGHGAGQIVGNTLRMGSTTDYVTLIGGEDGYYGPGLSGKLLKAWPMFLYMEAEVGIPSPFTTFGDYNESSVTWAFGLYGQWFEIKLFRENHYYASANSWEWESSSNTNPTLPTAGPGLKKIGLWFDGTHAKIVLGGSVVASSGDISASVLTAEESMCLYLWMDAKNDGNGAEIVVSDVRFYWGGTLSEAIAITS